WYDGYLVVEFVPGTIDEQQSFYLCLNEKNRIMRFLFMEDATMYNSFRMLADCDGDFRTVWGAYSEINKSFENKVYSFIVATSSTEKPY
ncbi:MAG: hypothetical protein J5494_07575, partial [Candidatus Methanomethylophilaceae archaeon]|nr:hypothetical protein [Candidatus Methanomethylophilaceae archaeon]